MCALIAQAQAKFHGIATNRQKLSGDGPLSLAYSFEYNCDLPPVLFLW